MSMPTPYVYLAGDAGVGVGEDLKTHALPSYHRGFAGPNSAPIGRSLLQVQHDGALINLASGGGWGPGCYVVGH
jgi:hypothetical protein